jgi:hypothetical protein
MTWFPIVQALLGLIKALGIFLIPRQNPASASQGNICLFNLTLAAQS